MRGTRNPARPVAGMARGDPGRGEVRLSRFGQSSLLCAAAVVCAAMDRPEPRPVPSPAPRAVCWVERVVEAGPAVRVVFQRDRQSYSVAGAGSFPLPRRPAADGAWDSGLPYLDLLPGESARLSNTPHDVCTLAAETRGGRLGALLSASFRAPGPAGPPPERVEVFVPAGPVPR